MNLSFANLFLSVNSTWKYWKRKKEECHGGYWRSQIIFNDQLHHWSCEASLLVVMCHVNISKQSYLNYISCEMSHFFCVMYEELLRKLHLKVLSIIQRWPALESCATVRFKRCFHLGAPGGLCRQSLSTEQQLFCVPIVQLTGPESFNTLYCCCVFCIDYHRKLKNK